VEIYILLRVDYLTCAGGDAVCDNGDCGVVTEAVIDRSHATGIGIVLAGGACLSLAGILLRNIDTADGWQILFYRASAFVVTLFVVLLVKYRSGVLVAFRRVGWPGIAVGICLGLGSVCYVFALLWTTVANAVFIIGSAPLFTALVAWLVMRERVHPLGIAAMLVALAGLGLMFADGFVAGRWIGNLLALGVVASFVSMLVILRYSREIDMLPATCLAGVVGGTIAFIMADDLIISGHDLILCLILGSVQFGAGFMLLTIGTRYIPAAEVALYSLSEAVLAPIWVWIGVDEKPSLLTLAGGAIVLTTVLVNGLFSLRRERRTGHAAQ